MRQALTYATDREGLSSLINQGTSPLADSMFHPDLIWNNPDVVQEGNMPELAGPLVESYCADVPENCTDGKIDMELQYSGPSVIQTRVADVLTAVGSRSSTSPSRSCCRTRTSLRLQSASSRS